MAENNTENKGEEQPKDNTNDDSMDGIENLFNEEINKDDETVERLEKKVDIILKVLQEMNKNKHGKNNNRRFKRKNSGGQGTSGGGGTGNEEATKGTPAGGSGGSGRGHGHYRGRGGGAFKGGRGRGGGFSNSPSYCPACGSTLRAMALFCVNCGTKI